MVHDKTNWDVAFVVFLCGKEFSAWAVRAVVFGEVFWFKHSTWWGRPQRCVRERLVVVIRSCWIFAGWSYEQQFGHRLVDSWLVDIVGRCSSDSAGTMHSSFLRGCRPSFHDHQVKVLAGLHFFAAWRTRHRHACFAHLQGICPHWLSRTCRCTRCSAGHNDDVISVDTDLNYCQKPEPSWS